MTNFLTMQTLKRGLTGSDCGSYSAITSAMLATGFLLF
jgi:hypothetical protein